MLSSDHRSGGTSELWTLLLSQMCFHTMGSRFSTLRHDRCCDDARWRVDRETSRHIESIRRLHRGLLRPCLCHALRRGRPSYLLQRRPHHHPACPFRVGRLCPARGPSEVLLSHHPEQPVVGVDLAEERSSGKWPEKKKHILSVHISAEYWFRTGDISVTLETPYRTEYN